jgi:hypothetical protein
MHEPARNGDMPWPCFEKPQWRLFITFFTLDPEKLFEESWSGPRGDWCVSLSNQHSPKKKQASLGDLHVSMTYSGNKLMITYLWSLWSSTVMPAK